MKKIYTLFIVIMASCALNAQITLTKSSHIPQIGNVFDYTQGSSVAGVDYSKSGANQTWDLSALEGTIQTRVEYITKANASLPNKYPDTDMVEKATYQGLQYISETYYSTSGSSLSMNCNYVPGATEVNYTNKREFINFPITYGNEFNESFSGTALNIAYNQLFDREGTINIKADGYGTLILPYRTLHNVLRVKVTSIYSDKYMGMPVASYNDVVYVWYNAFTNSYIANVSVGSTNGSVYSQSFTYMNQSDINTDVNEVKISSDEITFYPNPARDYIIFNTVGSDDEISVSVYDIKGVLVKTGTICDENMLNISDLKAGVYILKYTNGTELYAKKIIIE